MVHVKGIVDPLQSIGDPQVFDQFDIDGGIQFAMLGDLPGDGLVRSLPGVIIIQCAKGLVIKVDLHIPKLLWVISYLSAKIRVNSFRGTSFPEIVSFVFRTIYYLI